MRSLALVEKDEPARSVLAEADQHAARSGVDACLEGEGVGGVAERILVKMIVAGLAISAFGQGLAVAREEGGDGHATLKVVVKNDVFDRWRSELVGDLVVVLAQMLLAGHLEGRRERVVVLCAGPGDEGLCCAGAGCLRHAALPWCDKENGAAWADQGMGSMWRA